MKGKNRDAIILATKVSGPSHVWFKSPKRAGMTALDRHNIIDAVEESLTPTADRLYRPLPNPLARP